MTVGHRLALTLGALALGLTAPAAGASGVPAARLVQGPVHVLRPFVPAARTGAPVAGPEQLAYGGGTGGHGVQVHPAVYLVFWGSQWRQDDPYADYEQRFFRGLYRRGDDWTTVPRQYCQGIPAHRLACPRKAPHIGAPLRGGVLKGVWFDDAALAVPTDVWLAAGGGLDSVAQEAVRAAAHFGNTRPGANTDAQYIVNEPTHFDSVGYPVFCSYHSTVSSPYGTIVYADLPYLTDLESPTHDGLSCGQNAVNAGAAGRYDGVSIVAGHEFVEMLTDPFPGYGWLDASGQEAADKCQWLTSGPGRMTDLRLFTGTFAVQSTWSDAAANGRGGCVAHTAAR